MKTTLAPKIFAMLLAIAWLSTLAPAADTSRADASTYQGWKTLRLANPLIELQILPEIGGRIIQFKLGDREFLWVNPQLAGKFPEPNGLNAEGGWFNIGGDKLWPAPQGWDNDQQWPGPPDAVLDGQPYECESLAPEQPGEMAVRLTSRDVENRDIGLVDRHGFFNDAASGTFERIGLGVFFHQVDSVHDNVGIILAQRHNAPLAFVASCDDDHLIAFANFVHDQSLQNFRCQGHDLHELFSAQFTRHWPEDAGADGLELGIEQNCCIAVKFDQGAIAAANAFGSANYHGAVHLAFFDARTGRSFFDAYLDDVAYAGVAAT